MHVGSRVRQNDCKIATEPFIRAWQSLNRPSQRNDLPRRLGLGFPSTGRVIVPVSALFENLHSSIVYYILLPKIYTFCLPLEHESGSRTKMRRRFLRHRPPYKLPGQPLETWEGFSGRLKAILKPA